MKTSTRLIALISVMLMLLVMFAACKDPEGSTDVTTAAGADETKAPEETVDNNLDANGFEKDDIPEELDYNDAEVCILYWSDAERDEFEIEEITGDNLKDAIHQRNINIEERLGVKIAFASEIGANANRQTFVNTVSNSFKAGEKIYDVIGTYSRTAGMLAIQGYLADLNAIEDSYINKDKPWWPSAIVDTMGVGDALYYVSGDASTNTLHFMYTLYYNKNLITDLGLTDPTEYVQNKTWTLDKLIEITSNVYQDLDNDGKQSEADFYGFSTIYYGCDAFYTGSGLKLVERTDDDDLIKVSEDYFSEKTVNLVDKLGAWLNTNDCYVSRYGATVNFAVPFVNGTQLFCQNRVYLADNQHPSGLNSVEWKYGLVPTPMYDESQADYITVVGNPFSLYGIMTDCDEKSMCTAVIECWGSEAYRLTTPALFETNMKYKYTSEEIYAQMFDILRRTSSYDQGRIYSNDLGPYISEIPGKVMTNGGSWATTAKTYQKVLGRQLDKIIASFQKNQANG